MQKNMDNDLEATTGLRGFRRVQNHMEKRGVNFHFMRWYI